MKKIIFTIFACLILFSSNVFSSTLEEQLQAVAKAEQQAKMEQAAIIAAQQRRSIELQKQKEQAQLVQQQKLEAIAKAKDEERLLDKFRDQQHQDELRQLELAKIKLALEREEARVKRENEFIDQELKQKAAEADVIQSKADTNRNLSEGGRDLMQSLGRAEEEKASSWFK